MISVKQIVDFVSGVQNLITGKVDKNMPIKDVSTLPYTIGSADNGYFLRITSSTAGNISLDASLPVGFNCAVKQKGAGQVTFIAGVGSPAIESEGNRYKTYAQFALASVLKEDTTTFSLGGNLTA